MWYGNTCSPTSNWRCTIAPKGSCIASKLPLLDRAHPRHIRTARSYRKALCPGTGTHSSKGQPTSIFYLYFVLGRHLGALIAPSCCGDIVATVRDRYDAANPKLGAPFKTVTLGLALFGARRGRGALWAGLDRRRFSLRCYICRERPAQTAGAKPRTLGFTIFLVRHFGVASRTRRKIAGPLPLCCVDMYHRTKSSQHRHNLPC